MKQIEKELKSLLEGEVRFDTITRKIYSVDASIYEVEPKGVILPKSRKDILNLIHYADKHALTLIPRGAATGITGGCLGQGLIVDTSKHLNKITEINYERGYAICEPGVVQDQLNHALDERGYRLGPDTSTGNRATLGGMTANNSAGARSLKFGKMVDHVEAVEIALANGELIYFGPLGEREYQEKCQQTDREGHIYREMLRIRDDYRKEIETQFPKIPRRASGYNLDELIKGPFPNIAKLIVGSEGSLGIITRIKVRIVKKLETTGLCMIHFRHIQEGLEAVPELLKFHPISLEMIDSQIIKMGRLSPLLKNQLQWLKGDPEAVIVAEFEAPSLEEVKQKLTSFETQLQTQNIGYALTSLSNRDEMGYVWNLRKAGLGLLLSKRSYQRAIAFLEDVSVAPDQLASFMKKFMACLKKYGKEAGIYGHVGSGCMHVRPFIHLKNPEELKLMAALMEEVSDLLLEHGGSLSGEHGDGLIRSWLNQKMFGNRLYQAFIDLKVAFDPENRMNPGKIVYGPPLTENLRFDPEKKPIAIPTFLDFQPEGGFELAVDLCNGNGLCRKSETTMCPSFQATGDEFDTTRARAQTLRSVVNGKLSITDFTSPAVHQVLDLCLECKGCKKECPSQVDMAKMKSEFLYHYQKRHGLSFRSRLFGHLGTINSWLSPFASLYNYFNNTSLGVWTRALFGIAVRPLPSLAKQRFSGWLKMNHDKVDKSSHGNSKRQVVLFNDTYSEFHCPEVGQGAFQVLTKLGYEVIVPEWHCCGRPLISKGMLKEAQEKAKRVVELLLPYAQKGIPIIGLEPSCLSAIKDDYTGLLGMDNGTRQIVAAACMSLDEFLYDLIQEGKFPASVKKEGLDHDQDKHRNRPVKLHGHCHQKALEGTNSTLNVLKAVEGNRVSEIASGCCGLAGSFGYEAEHYQLSMEIGSLHLFPAINHSSEDTVIIANGFSCRSQIEHGTGRKALHLAEWLADFI